MTDDRAALAARIVDEARHYGLDSPSLPFAIERLLVALPPPVEALAWALERTGHCGDAHRQTLGIVPEEHDHADCLFRPRSLEDAAAIIAAWPSEP